MKIYQLGILFIVCIVALFVPPLVTKAQMVPVITVIDGGMSPSSNMGGSDWGSSGSSLSGDDVLSKLEHGEQEVMKLLDKIEASVPLEGLSPTKK